jgi:hypothetical protein
MKYVTNDNENENETVWTDYKRDPRGVVSFRRRVLSVFPKWSKSTKPLRDLIVSAWNHHRFILIRMRMSVSENKSFVWLLFE